LCRRSAWTACTPACLEYPGLMSSCNLLPSTSSFILLYIFPFFLTTVYARFLRTFMCMCKYKRACLAVFLFLIPCWNECARHFVVPAVHQPTQYTTSH
jgi:hypothetical protein